MSKDIRIKKGLDINLQGAAEKQMAQAIRSNTYAINPDDFHGVIPKIIAKVGTEVKAGSPLFYSKSNDQILFNSPVSGEVVEIVRGAKRKILFFKVLADKEQQYEDFGAKNVASMSGDDVKSHLLQAGCWPFIKQRPYDIMANPEVAPKAIFVSGYNSAPLAADLDFILSGKENELDAAITALSKLTTGKVHISVNSQASPLAKVNNAEIHNISGPHPIGNVSTQIAKVDPINKGEIVWVVSAQDLVVIGELLLTGKYNATRKIAVAGSSVKSPKYYETKIGAEVSTFIYDAGVNNDNVRMINGNVLTGTTVNPDGHLASTVDTFTVIPEGNDYEFFGWNKPVFDKISYSRALTFSWLFPKKKYDLDTNTNGEHRAFVVTGNYEDVFPLDIYPLQLLKAFTYNDLDEMEKLGAYEIAPEDFALTEFVCVSKQNHQDIVRKGLDVMYKEIG
ncbi:Na(+)-translocating NADH-quinone reductase subunit A [Aquimarina agarivorans]|uniref:Na(+)-translocating NADH-quinone reductase subunit A n=1 Tax=Aquimarina agarivorans TaxID=980584 RepID=UPI000248FB59|nr:Na(+)-translocating NADH-quinone reductase subunit A [Aquimarina agarivorans]